MTVLQSQRASRARCPYRVTLAFHLTTVGTFLMRSGLLFFQEYTDSLTIALLACWPLPVVGKVRHDMDMLTYEVDSFVQSNSTIR